MSFAHRLVRLSSALVAAACLSACVEEATSLPSWDEFLTAATRVADGELVYVIDGDIRVTLGQLERAYDDLHAAHEVEARSAVNTVGGAIDTWTGGAQRNLAYCVSNDFGADKARVAREMSAATRAWELAAAVDFRYVPAQDATCTANNTAVRFAVRPWNEGGAMAFFPSSPASARTLWINLADLDGPGCDHLPRLTTTGVFRHELGHILGLRHEHTRPESSVCHEDSAWEALGAYDRRSVMHYQWCNGVSTTDLSLTVADQQGIRALYGPPVVVRHDHAVPVDFNADGRADLGLTGPVEWASLPVALSTGNGFGVHNNAAGDFPGFAAVDGAMAVTGDFNCDGRTDVALTGPSSWNSLPVAFSTGNGGFNVTNAAISGWSDWAEQDNARVLTGDYNSDGCTDLALLGPAGWQTLPVALSNANGTFAVSNAGIGWFAAAAAADNARLITGDFDGDAYADIALTGVTSWNTLPVAHSNGDGTFTVSNHPVGWFAGAAATPGVVVVAGDFNGDGRTDVALTGPAAWNTIPVAISSANGGFTTTNNVHADLATWSAVRGAQVLTGDFNADGKTDLALTGPSTWASLPVALSLGDGSFSVKNIHIGAFADMAEVGSRPLVGDFNGDGKTDIALTGPASWASIPVAYSTGTGAFSVQNHQLGGFPGFASHEGVTTLW